ncbi:hypothetical protein [Methanofollis fontis]|uniref:Uncharacterized protein n=1 Tax=Methanofollis fontis TaxID=2052832 RepID=A0A483CR04_9EURY|nr:hypothetical protein [Methanofollis fontis]TAJ45543.1 hypothetical protein CUJ86_02115 [Methanofollis fontis]
MKERFVVLWRRSKNAPCPYRSSDTDRSLPELLKEILPLLREGGVETEVRVEEAGNGAGIFFNDLPLDDLIAIAGGAERYCSGPSRMEELGRPDLAFDPDAPFGCVVPEILFRKAVLLALED